MVLAQPAWLCRPTAGITDRITEYYQQHRLAAPASIVDMGCSTGISSRWFRRMYPEADIVGLDLSPYFLAVAQLEEQRVAAAGGQQKPIRWVWCSVGPAARLLAPVCA